MSETDRIEKLIVAWRNCRHDYVTSDAGRGGDKWVVCRRCGRFMETSKTLWRELRAWEDLL